MLLDAKGTLVEKTVINFTGINNNSDNNCYYYKGSKDSRQRSANALSTQLATLCQRVLKTVLSNAIQLNTKQKIVFATAYQKRKSIFFTKAAGTKKLIVIQHFVKALKEQYSDNTDKLAVLMLTKIAVCTIGRITIYR